MRQFKQYDLAYALVNGKRKLIFVHKQSEVWTKGTLVSAWPDPWRKPRYVRVKSDSLLPIPSLTERYR